MRAREVFREAFRNVASGTARASSFCMILAAIVVMLLTFDGAAARADIDKAADFVASGASTLVFHSPRGVDGRRCESLATLENVRASGATRAIESKIFARALPASGIPTFEGTPGFVRTLRGVGLSSGTGVYVSRLISEELGVSDGLDLSTSDGDLRVAGTFDYPDDGRKGGYEYSIVVPTLAAGLFDECWVIAWPQDDTIASLLSMAGSSSADTSVAPTVGQLNTSLGTLHSGGVHYQHRLSRFADLVGSAGGFLCGFIAVWLRRLPLSSSRHLGVRRLDQIAMVVCEYSLWGFIAMVCGTPALIWALAGLDPADAFPIALNLLRIPVAAFIGGLAGAVMATLLVREKALFRYFATR